MSQTGSEPYLFSATDVDARGGSGSMSVEEDWARSNSREPTNDGRSETETTFYPWDVESDGPSQEHRDPDDRSTWGELSKTNDGVGDSGRREANRQADRRRWVRVFGSQIDCTSYQIERAEAIIDSIDFAERSWRNVAVEVYILGVLSLVVDEEESGSDDWTVDDWIVHDDQFVEMMRAIGMTHDDLWTVRECIQEDSGLL
jgi:hypothetical protein